MQHVMNCPKCGTPLPQGDLGEQAFCQECGDFVAPEIDEEALRESDERFLDIGESALASEDTGETAEAGYELSNGKGP